MRYELKIALRYLRARRKDAFISITTIFTAVGVMIGVAALTMTLSVMGGFEQSIKERVLNLSPQVQILNSQGSIENYTDIEKKAATVPGVERRGGIYRRPGDAEFGARNRRRRRARGRAGQSRGARINGAAT